MLSATGVTMTEPVSTRTQFAQLTLRISDSDTSLRFYVELLGMTLFETRRIEGREHHFLGYMTADLPPEAFDIERWQSCCLLELVVVPEGQQFVVRQQPDASAGYWKIALSLPELDVARERLVEHGVAVDEPRQVGDIAYLCHFQDPDGYCIELIQHDFLQNHTPATADSRFKLGSQTVFSLITLRVKDAEASLRFYTENLGMRLLSVQPVAARGFTLYFLSLNDEAPPHADLEAVENREWLWRRPYTLLELQHVWGTEGQAEFNYAVGPETGFLGFTLAKSGTGNSERVEDPDGYLIDIVRKHGVL